MSRNRHTKEPLLRRYQQRNGLTQEELAAKLDVNRATVAWLVSMTSPRKPGRPLAEQIAKLIGKRVGQVVDDYAHRPGAAS